MIGSAILVALFLAIRESKLQGVEPEFFLDFVIFGIPVAIIGARLYYVIFRWEIYKHNFKDIIAVWEGGLAIHGALIGGILVLGILIKKRGVSFWQAVDILAPSVALGQAIGRWGNFINQEAYGGIVSQDYISHFPVFIQKQMFINGYYHHPAFFYEFLWDLLIFIFLIWLRRRDFIKKGDIFLSYIIAYSAGRYFIEAIRTDSLMLGSIQVARLLSLFLIVTGSAFLYWRHSHGSN